MTHTASSVPRASRVIAVLWAGFLSACLATLLFFACFDPVQLLDDRGWPPWFADRRSGYALGFFFFWGMGTLAASLSAWLLTPAVPRDAS